MEGWAGCGGPPKAIREAMGGGRERSREDVSDISRIFISQR